MALNGVKPLSESACYKGVVVFLMNWVFMIIGCIEFDRIAFSLLHIDYRLTLLYRTCLSEIGLSPWVHALGLNMTYVSWRSYCLATRPTPQHCCEVEEWFAFWPWHDRCNASLALWVLFMSWINNMNCGLCGCDPPQKRVASLWKGSVKLCCRAHAVHS